MKQVRQGKFTKKITPARQAKRTTSRYFKWFWRMSLKKKIAVIAIPILIILIIIPLATYAYFARDIGDMERLMNRNNTGVAFLDKDGGTFYSIGRSEHRNMLGLEQINDNVEQALIASEDKDFYKHGGFNILSIFRAALTRYGGGSTITQQLAKNTLLSNQQTFLRKYQELFMSIAIEQQYSKDQILSMYLNSVYYGENAFGIEDAAKTYFGKSPADLTLAESAMLIGLLPAPSAYSPISGNPQYAKERQEVVLDRMVKNSYITEEQKKAALAEQLAYADQSTRVATAPHFVEMVMKELNDKYGEEKVMRSGYQVQTTLDRTLQSQLEANMAKNMTFIQRNGGSNASAVAIEPSSGQVRALVGSADYNNEQWGKVNMVTTARQPASTFKSIYYAAALADGVVTPATVLHDKPINIGGWQPKNADRRFRGDVTLRSAISQSLNIPSIEVMQKYGIEKSAAAANNLGITAIDPSKQYDLTMAIGSYEVPLLQMTNAYAAFGNKGIVNKTTFITKINDKFSKEIFRSQQTGKRGISEAGAFLISNILSDNAARAPIFGSSLTVPGKTAAVKTGTSDENRDAYTIGYTPTLAIGVWVGNNDNAVMANGGSGMAGPIWRDTMRQALASTPDQKFTPPSGVVQRSTCYSSHGIATNNVREGTYSEYYLSSALPTETCTPEEKKPIEVCDIEAKKIETIDEKDFDETKHSKDLAACQQPKQIQVCEIATGSVKTIDEDDFDSTKHSRTTANCKPPTTNPTNPTTPGNGNQNPGGPTTPPPINDPTAP